MSTYENRRYPEKTSVVSMGDRAKYTKKPKRRSLFSAMNQLWQGLLAAAAGENEVRIWQTRDRNGNTCWHGCDRATGRSISAATDDEMRAIIDRRYCQ
ncbi:MAG: hypothetical protein JGK17_02660 [Microcoleus sp. PH2017_10_PVI_O_A]|uniref:hypothetical protein n=1 Tax=unclassified Microcoleus TaxID=2642155 RepID=UPI001DB41AD0|nr:MULTISPECIES: hypothetical protein [unclassified Microcoleus]TAE83483.1 MAG: hypothetical protein EAZ83_09305 [Oscillatoriales cyanobacterium]MCC3404488.1 hypothetical protein [Microcoleus sp. PH2017_10_PVI_O_A]MCC3458556.1 hypothetical protein [Microcoleus sp. PH2017_11_PCY_U_A]MCC3476806.1 hypothetical protein [Microcoleus sp. PH2017_12_PCY_D_A]MCC3526944.1 hypothetical protein [Microcoleus sp. PH2017_21_RUC_O_A]